MAVSAVLIVATGGTAVAVAMAAVAVTIPPTRRERMLRVLAAFSKMSGPQQRVTRTPVDVMRPASGGLVQRIADVFAAGPIRVRLHRQLDFAGNPAAWPIERVIRTRLLTATFFTLFGYAFAHGVAPDRWVIGIPAGFAIGLFLPDILIYNAGVKRQAAIGRSLPDVLDAMVIGVEAGLGLDSAMSQVANLLSGPMPDELHRVLQEMKLGVARTVALRALATRTNVRELRTLVTALVQAGELGISVAGILREHAQDQRLRRRQRAEEQAQKVAVKLLFPVLFCLFPVIFVVVIGPAVLRMIKVFS